jgi:hypothetical protein
MGWIPVGYLLKCQQQGMPVSPKVRWTLIGKAVTPPTSPESDRTVYRYACSQCKEPSTAILHCVCCATLGSGTADSVHVVDSGCPSHLQSALHNMEMPGNEKVVSTAGLLISWQSGWFWRTGGASFIDSCHADTGKGEERIRRQPSNSARYRHAHTGSRASLPVGRLAPAGGETTSTTPADGQADPSLGTYANKEAEGHDNILLVC